MVMDHAAEMGINKLDINNKSKKKFSLQWHITAECDQNCLHCYVRDPNTYKREVENILSLDDCKKVIDSLVDFSDKINAKPNITFTGGDPLLRKDFFDIANYAKEKGTTISILGNPYHLNENNLLRLKDLGIKGYQISIDGMREVHDKFRRMGSFDSSINAINDLKKYNIRTVVMFTMSKENMQELIPVMNLVDRLEVNSFAFARACGFGNGKDLEMFTAEEYRDILLRAYTEEKRLITKGSKTSFNKKDHLWVLLLNELGDLSYKPTEDGMIYGGCSIGCNSFCILSDGTAFACRRFYSPIGKVPEKSVKDIFLSKELDYYRDIKYEKCNDCDLIQYCRGCPAVAYGKTGIFGSPDPQCWKK